MNDKTLLVGGLAALMLAGAVSPAAQAQSDKEMGTMLIKDTRIEDAKSVLRVRDTEIGKGRQALADLPRRVLRRLAARDAALIRVDALWLAVEPLDMRAGTETALARVVAVFGAARPHHAYLFANRRANRMKVLVHDGIGVWLAARRLNSGKFVWPRDGALTASLNRPQFDALVLGLPWQRLCSPGCPRTRPATSTSSCRTAGSPLTSDRQTGPSAAVNMGSPDAYGRGVRRKPDPQNHGGKSK